MNQRKMFVLPFAIAAVLVGVASAVRTGGQCGSAAMTPPTPVAMETQAVDAPSGGGVSGEMVYAEEAEGDDLKKVRQAARDLVQAEFPGSKTDGVFTLTLARGNELFVAGVDTKLSDGKRVTVDLLVRKYVRKNGGAYWKAERIGRAGEAQELIARYVRDAAQRQEEPAR